MTNLLSPACGFDIDDERFLGTTNAVSLWPLGASGLVDCVSSETSGIGGLLRFLGISLSSLLCGSSPLFEEAFVEVLDGLPRFIGTTGAISSLPLGASGLVNCAAFETLGIGGLPRFLRTTDAVSSWAPG